MSPVGNGMRESAFHPVDPQELESVRESARRVQQGEGNFKIENILAQGAHGTVYKVRTPRGGVYALKRACEGDEVELANEERILTRAAGLEGVVRLIARVGNGLLFPLASRGSLEKVLSKKQPITRDQQRQLARALFELHERNIVHRDISLNNILVCQDGTLTLTDFGSALTLTEDRQLVEPTSLLGTFYAMPPEVLQQQVAYNPFKADVYSLGVVFYCIATQGERYPFEFDTDADHPPPSPSYVWRVARMKSGPNLDRIEDPLLKALIGRMLDSDPKNRPSMAEVPDDPYFTS